MPRTYKADPNKKRYKKYEPDVLSNALRELKESNESLQKIADKYNIHKSVLYRHSKKKLKHKVAKLNSRMKPSSI